MPGERPSTTGSGASFQPARSTTVPATAPAFRPTLARPTRPTSAGFPPSSFPLELARPIQPATQPAGPASPHTHHQGMTPFPLHFPPCLPFPSHGPPDDPTHDRADRWIAPPRSDRFRPGVPIRRVRLRDLAAGDLAALPGSLVSPAPEVDLSGQPAWTPPAGGRLGLVSWPCLSAGGGFAPTRSAPGPAAVAGVDPGRLVELGQRRVGFLRPDLARSSGWHPGRPGLTLPHPFARRRRFPHTAARPPHLALTRPSPPHGATSLRSSLGRNLRVAGTIPSLVLAERDRSRLPPPSPGLGLGCPQHRLVGTDGWTDAGPMTAASWPGPALPTRWSERREVRPACPLRPHRPQPDPTLPGGIHPGRGWVRSAHVGGPPAAAPSSARPAKRGSDQRRGEDAVRRRPGTRRAGRSGPASRLGLSRGGAGHAEWPARCLRRSNSRGPRDDLPMLPPRHPLAQRPAPHRHRGTPRPPPPHRHRRPAWSHSFVPGFIPACTKAVRTSVTKSMRPGGPATRRPARLKPACQVVLSRGGSVLQQWTRHRRGGWVGSIRPTSGREAAGGAAPDCPARTPTAESGREGLSGPIWG